MRALPVVALAAVVLAAVLTPGSGAPQDGGEVNVSRLPGLQSGAAIAIDPTREHVLLAGSNSVAEGAVRIYGSTDAGRTWQSTLGHARPRSRRASCSSDPGVGVDRRGRQYYSFVRAVPCRDGAVQHVYVVTRAGPSARWSRPIRVAPLGGARFDDKPALAVDVSPASPHTNRVYVAWSRVSRAGVFSIRISHSDDGGRTWSPPAKVNRSGRELTYASVAVSRRGVVYVAWHDVSEFGLRIARSTDGGKRFGPERTVAAFAAVTIPHCGNGIVIPALPLACVQANPVVTVDTSRGPYSGRVYVSFAKTEFRGSQLAHVAAFDARLRWIGRRAESREAVPVAPGRPGERDQFWPQSAVDSTTGTVWACFYDTVGDPERKRAFYSCTISRNGGRTWARPRRAATVASDETQPGAAGHYGYYQGLAASGGVAHPIWTDSRDLPTLGEEIYTTRLVEADFPPR
jgi:hypothetical protein